MHNDGRSDKAGFPSRRTRTRLVSTADRKEDSRSLFKGRTSLAREESILLLEEQQRFTNEKLNENNERRDREGIMPNKLSPTRHRYGNELQKLERLRSPEGSH